MPHPQRKTGVVFSFKKKWQTLFVNRQQPADDFKGRPSESQTSYIQL